MLNQTNERRRDFGEEVKGHGALAARTAGWDSLQNTSTEYSPYHEKNTTNNMQYTHAPRAEYAAITPTTSMPTDTIEPLL